jgi:hypothetical protein
LLRILLLRLSAVSANSSSARWRTGCCLLLCVTGDDQRADPNLARLAGQYAHQPVGVMPKAAILAGLFVPVSVRAVIWIIALVWMGTACILNARRCNRTHCRYTGPYYLAMIVPVVVLGMGVVSAGPQSGYGGSSPSVRPDIAHCAISVVSQKRKCPGSRGSVLPSGAGIVSLPPAGPFGASTGQDRLLV